MKKINYLGITVLGLGALCLSGCGNDHTLKCEMKGAEQTNVVEITFNSDETKAEKVYMELTMNVGDGASDEQIEQSKELLLQGCEQANYQKCNVSVSGTKLTYSFETEPDLVNFDSKGIDEVRAAAEEDGYTCK